MSELPSATVANAKPPFYQRAGFRTVVKVALIVAACAVGWKLFKRFTRPESSKELAVRQDKARKIVGKAFDKLFDDQLDDGKTDVKIESRFKLEGGLGESYASETGCAKGFTDAFKDALGPDVVTFTSTSWKDASNTLTFTGTVSPHGSGFQLPNSPTVYQGIGISGDIEFLGKKVHVDITPPDDIQFDYSTYGFSLDSHGPSESDVAAGILQGSCKEAGLELLEHMTPWLRPEPEKRDPVKECEQGFHCQENAAALAATDKPKAARMFLKACDNHEDDACIRAADLAIEARKPGTEMDSMGAIGIALEMDCHMEIVSACSGAGRIALTPEKDGDEPSDYRRQQALLSFLRGCDLGDPDQCTAAAPLVKGTPFADAQLILSGEKQTVVSKKLGTVFGLHWGQWHQIDNGQPTIWTTTKPPAPPKDAMVTTFSDDKIPDAIHPPAGIRTVYAIALRGGGGEYDRECTACQPNLHGHGPFDLAPVSCVCALSPVPATTDP
ncbi:MAG TPA: hypothetical protein VGM90_31450 [Kofleriaceae bacterium]|jgi:hypothetical protein